MTTPANSRTVSRERTEAPRADRLHEWYTLEDRPRAQSPPRALSPPGWTAELSSRGESMGGPSLTSPPTPELMMATTMASSSQLVLGSSARAPKAASEDDPRGGACLGHSADLLWPQPTVQSVTTAGALQQQSQQHQQTDDSDLFSFLAGSRPPRTPHEGGPSGFGGTSTLRRVAPSLPTFGLGAGSDESLPVAASGMQLIPAGTVGSPAPAAAPSTQDLQMILKTMQSFVTELPKLEAGEPATRARKYQQWVLQVSQALAPTGAHVMGWWSWVQSSALEAHKEFVETPLDRREHAFPRLRVPPEHATVECWMRPRILACLPKPQRDWIELRAQAGTWDESNVLLFYALKFSHRVVQMKRMRSSGASSILQCAPMPRQHKSSS